MVVEEAGRVLVLTGTQPQKDRMSSMRMVLR